MARPLTEQLIREQIHKYSAWGGFLDLVKDGSMPMSEAIRMMGLMFKGGFLPHTLEAKGEVQSLSKSLTKLEGICRLGAAAKTEAQMRMQIDVLYNELYEIDRIVVELYETHLTMYGWIDPVQAKNKPLEMAKAMDALNKRRLTEGLILKDPSTLERVSQ
jgi:hypothetical protein